MIRRSLAALALGSGAAVIAALPPAHAATVVHILPGKVKVGTRITVAASGLARSSMYTFLLTIPDARAPRFEQFLGVTRSTASGTVKYGIKIPLLSLCGKATINVILAGKPVGTAGTFTLTGCKPIHLPAPPPHKP